MNWKRKRQEFKETRSRLLRSYAALQNQLRKTSTDLIKLNAKLELLDEIEKTKDKA